MPPFKISISRGAGMLKLQRKYQQQIIITLPNNELITITVAKIRPGIVNLGFEAPDNVHIDRSEVFIKHTLERREQDGTEPKV